MGQRVSDNSKLMLARVHQVLEDRLATTKVVVSKEVVAVLEHLEDILDLEGGVAYVMVGVLRARKAERVVRRRLICELSAVVHHDALLAPVMLDGVELEEFEEILAQRDARKVLGFAIAGELAAELAKEGEDKAEEQERAHAAGVSLVQLALAEHELEDEDDIAHLGVEAEAFADLLQLVQPIELVDRDVEVDARGALHELDERHLRVLDQRDVLV